MCETRQDCGGSGRSSDRGGVTPKGSLRISGAEVTEGSRRLKCGANEPLTAAALPGFAVSLAATDYSAAARPWPSRLFSVSSSAAAASAITVPGGKIAAAPACLSVS